jgi:hypothetical protein
LWDTEELLERLAEFELADRPSKVRTFGLWLSQLTVREPRLCQVASAWLSKPGRDSHF